MRVEVAYSPRSREVDCVSLDRAVEIAARMPESGLGTVEVRQVMESLADFL